MEKGAISHILQRKKLNFNICIIFRVRPIEFPIN